MPKVTIVLVLAGALLLTGCSSGGSGPRPAMAAPASDRTTSVPTPAVPSGFLDGPVPDLPPGYAQAPSWPPVPPAALPAKKGSPLAGTSEQVPKDPGPLGQVDWPDRTYPTGCLGSNEVRLRKASASNGSTVAAVRPAVYGDLNGDGKPEALLTLTCTGGNRQPDSALLYTEGSAGQPELVGRIVSETDRMVVEQVEFRDQRLVVVGLGYSSTPPTPKPDLAVTQTSRLEAGKLIRETVSVDPVEILYEGDEGDTVGN